MLRWNYEYAKIYDEDDITRLARILAEEIEDHFKPTFEPLTFIKEQVKKIPIIEQKLDALSDDIVAVRALLKRHDREVKQLQSTAHSH